MDNEDIEIKRLNHLKQFVEQHPFKIEHNQDKYIRVDDISTMIDKTIGAVRKEKAHKNRN